MFRRTIGGAAAAALAAGASFAGLPELELRAAFPADRDYISTPLAEGLATEELRLESTGGAELRGWFLGALHNDTYQARDPGYVAAYQRLFSHVEKRS